MPGTSQFRHESIFNYLKLAIMKENLKQIIRRVPQQVSAGIRLICCVAVAALLQFTAAAQPGASIKISGRVTSAQGEALRGVTVNVKNTSASTTTDDAGNFTITAAGNATLVFSYVGYKAQEVAVAGRANITILLETAVNTMNDVVIVGYNTQRRSSIAGSIANVDMGSLSKTRIADVGQALQGQVAGVFVAANTGAPGDGIKIRIRGEGTLGDNDVLYVVDGVPTRDISFLNQADIKSMTVLKDAAASAIYGSRAAGGVVLITTMSGVKGKTNIAVDYNTGFYNATNMPKMLDANQYLTVKDIAWHNTAGNSASAVSPYAQLRTRTDLANTN
jgi:TonB-dependent starch-binding outer membrane protein SusC